MSPAALTSRAVKVPGCFQDMETKQPPRTGRCRRPRPVRPGRCRPPRSGTAYPACGPADRRRVVLERAVRPDREDPVRRRPEVGVGQRQVEDAAGAGRRGSTTRRVLRDPRRATRSRPRRSATSPASEVGSSSVEESKARVDVVPALVRNQQGLGGVGIRLVAEDEVVRAADDRQVEVVEGALAAGQRERVRAECSMRRDRGTGRKPRRSTAATATERDQRTARRRAARPPGPVIAGCGASG